MPENQNSCIIIYQLDDNYVRYNYGSPLTTIKIDVLNVVTDEYVLSDSDRFCGDGGAGSGYTES